MKAASQLLLLVFLGILAVLPWFAVILLGVLAPILIVVFLLYCTYCWFRYVLFSA
jgi:hypothetical protein